MECPGCGKDKKLYLRLPTISNGKVCSNCKIIWRRENEPGFAEKEKQNAREYYRLHKIQKQEYGQKNRKARTEYEKLRCSSNPTFRLARRLRTRIANSIRHGSAVRDLGCSIPELKAHLEARFQPGMTWDNYGLYGWHVDHIKPLSSFDLTDRGQFLQACHYTNLQPLWAFDNLSKGAKCQ